MVAGAHKAEGYTISATPLHKLIVARRVSANAAFNTMAENDAAVSVPVTAHKAWIKGEVTPAHRRAPCRCCIAHAYETSVSVPPNKKCTNSG